MRWKPYKHSLALQPTIILIVVNRTLSKEIFPDLVLVKHYAILCDLYYVLDVFA